MIHDLKEYKNIRGQRNGLIWFKLAIKWLYAHGAAKPGQLEPLYLHGMYVIGEVYGKPKPTQNIPLPKIMLMTGGDIIREYQQINAHARMLTKPSRIHEFKRTCKQVMTKVHRHNLYVCNTDEFPLGFKYANAQMLITYFKKIISGNQVHALTY